jgi:adenosylmethionine-8-amino-7-oxononanoate aminotransferase
VDRGESAVFYRQPGDQLPVIVRADGCTLWDDTGHRVVDLASGISTTASIGQGRPEIAAAMGGQAERLAFIHNSWVTNDRQEELAIRYARLAPEDVNKVMFTSGGSEANELSLRLARQYHLARGEPRRWKVISVAPSYHGATMGALSMTGRWDINTDYEPYLFPHIRIPAPVLYRGPFQDLEPKEAGLRAADTLADAIEAAGPDTVAAFIGEPISPSAGMVVPDPVYWQRIREICDHFGVLLIADEVVTGAGRTGYFVAMDHFGVTADLSNLGKGLTGGYAPLAATLVRDTVSETITEAGRGVSSVHTYAGNPIGCAVGLAVLDVIESENLIQRSRDVGARAMAQLEEHVGNLPWVGGIRGLGLLIGIEYVQSIEGRERYPASTDVGRSLWDAMWEKGFLLRTLRHSTALVGDATNFVPALIIDEEQVASGVEALRDTLLEVAPGWK